MHTEIRKSATRKSSRRTTWAARTTLVAAAAAALVVTGATPAFAAQDNYGYGSCSPATVVSVTTSTVDAFHINWQGSNFRYTDWNDLFLVLPETRRAYPNYTYVTESNLGSSGWLVSTGRECG